MNGAPPVSRPPQTALQLAPVSEFDAEWTTLDWENGRLYRWRLDRARTYALELSDYVERAPGVCRWELEVLHEDGSWRVVRLGTRRDEIWLQLTKDGVPS